MEAWNSNFIIYKRKEIREQQELKLSYKWIIICWSIFNPLAAEFVSCYVTESFTVVYLSVGDADPRLTPFIRHIFCLYLFNWNLMQLERYKGKLLILFRWSNIEIVFINWILVILVFVVSGTHYDVTISIKKTRMVQIHLTYEHISYDHTELEYEAFKAKLVTSRLICFWEVEISFYTSG